LSSARYHSWCCPCGYPRFRLYVVGVYWEGGTGGERGGERQCWFCGVDVDLEACLFNSK